MKYFYENDIVKQGWANYAQLNRGSAKSINVRFCRDCSFFKPNFCQPEESLLQDGWCRRMSDEDVPFYVDVTSNSFCHEDEICILN